MRIGLVAPPGPPVPAGSGGGTAAVVVALARGLRAAGHDVVLLPVDDGRARRPDGDEPRARRPRSDGAVEHHRATRVHERLAGCDIVHDHTLTGSLAAVRRKGRADRPRSVATNHDRFRDADLPAWREIAERATVVALSGDQAATARGLPIARVIAYGVDFDRYPRGSGDGGYLLFLGRMAPAYGVDLAVRAARHAALPLVVAADRHHRDELAYFDECVRPLLGADVDVVGDVTGRARAQLLGGARGLVHPVREHEPFALALIEALACGTPVLALRSGSAPEIVDEGRTGFLADGFAELVEGMTRLGELDRDTCRAVAARRFSLPRLVAEHLDLYRSVLAAPPRRPARRPPTTRVVTTPPASWAARPGPGAVPTPAATGAPPGRP